METCKICKGEQDTKIYKNYNICTECSDVMEDLMSEYFVRTIRYSVLHKNKGYMEYILNGKEFVTNYQRIRRHSKRHIKHMEEHVVEEKQKGEIGGKKRYLDRVAMTIKWLKGSPEFYNFYFKDYYVCTDCGASIFDHYNKQNTGDWLMITCDRCHTVIKKYFSPKFVR